MLYLYFVEYRFIEVFLYFLINDPACIPLNLIGHNDHTIIVSPQLAHLHGPGPVLSLAVIGVPGKHGHAAPVVPL